MKQGPSRRLPEFLFAAAIILLTVLLIAKSYTRSIAQSGRMACLNNVSQLCRGLTMYSADHDQRLPLGPAWQDLVVPYASALPNTLDWSAFYCPARGSEPGYSYGLNSGVVGLSDHAIPTPAQTILLVDVRNSTREIWWANDRRFVQLAHNRAPWPCHVLKANYGFCDGHVVTRDPLRLTEANWLVGGR